MDYWLRSIASGPASSWAYALPSWRSNPPAHMHLLLASVCDPTQSYRPSSLTPSSRQSRQTSAPAAQRAWQPSSILCPGHTPTRETGSRTPLLSHPRLYPWSGHRAAEGPIGAALDNKYGTSQEPSFLLSWMYSRPGEVSHSWCQVVTVSRFAGPSGAVRLQVNRRPSQIPYSRAAPIYARRHPRSKRNMRPHEPSRGVTAGVIPRPPRSAPAPFPGLVQADD